MPTITKGTLCQLAVGPADSKPKWFAWAPGSTEQPAVSTPYKAYALAATTAAEEADLCVMTFGYLRGVSEMNGETWAVGEMLWAASDGSLTHTRPDAPLPQVFCGIIMEDEGSTFALDVYVRMVPSLGELSGVQREDPVDKDVFIYNGSGEVWEPRQIDHGADLAGLSDDDHAQYVLETDLIHAFLFMGGS